MSALSRRSRRLASATTAAASPNSPPPARLLDLPTDLLVRVVSRCDPVDIARVAAVSLLFHASLAEAGIRLRLQEAGYEVPAQPESESSAVRWLCFYVLLREANPPARLGAGLRHSVFIDGEGRLSSCGTAAEGEEDEEDEEDGFVGLLGHGEGVLQLKTPTRLPSLFGGERAIGVAASCKFSLALSAHGDLWSWGCGGQGELGHGDTQSKLLPKKVEAFAGQRVIAVSARDSHSLALTADGAVWSWGDGGLGELGHGDEQNQLLPKKIEALAGQHVVAVSAGQYHSLALTADGAVWGWGGGGEGKLGHGDQQNQLLPRKIEAFAGQRVVAVSAGCDHSLALTADGALWSWGFGVSGRLGHGDEQRQWQPKKVEAFADQRVVAVSAGLNHSLALTADGSVWSWGSGVSGKLGHGDEQEQLLPKKVEGLAGQCVVAASIGHDHSLAITADGAVWSWGYGGQGRLGHGDHQHQLVPKKIETFAGRRVIALSAGEDHSLALTADGAAWSWGYGAFGRLGHGDEQRQLLPKKIEAFAGQRFVAVSAGARHSFAITADGAVWSWGDGDYGRLGHGDEHDQLLPKKLEALAGQRVVAVSAGKDHSIALTADGAVLAWGEGALGCLGHGEDLSNQLLPKKIES